MMSAAYQAPWIQLGPASPGAPRLLCVPYSAKGASLFRDWPQLLGPAAEVGAVQLPGREDRLTEKAMDRIDELLADLIPAVLPWMATDAPFVLFGHCMGALVAGELMLPAARADSALCEDIRRHGRPEQPGLSCPLTLYAARDDLRFAPEQMRGWEALTGQPATLRVFDGDHAFLDNDQEPVVDALRAILAAVGGR